MNKRGRADLAHAFDPLDVAIYRLVHDFRGGNGEEGAPALAKACGGRPGVIQNKADPGCPEQTPNVKDLRRWMLAAKDFEPLSILAEDCGFVTVHVEKFNATGDVGLLEQYAQLDDSRGRVGAAIHTALTHGHLTQSDVRHIRQATLKEIESLEGLLARLNAIAEPEGKK